MYCCVPFCKSNGCKKLPNIQISFHEFPVDEALSRQWLRRIARKDFVPNDKSGSSVVCSLHFTPEDYLPTRKVRRLKKGAIPTVFPMYPSYALLPPPNNNHDGNVKNPPITYGSKNSRKRVDLSILYNETNSTNKSPDQYNEDGIFIKEEEINQHDSSLLQTLNHLKKLSTENTKKKVATVVTSNSEMASIDNKSSTQSGVVHAFLINEATEDPTALNKSQSFANFNQVKVPFTEEDGTDIDFDSNMISVNNNSPEEPVHVLAFNEENADVPFIEVNETETPKVKDGPGIAFTINVEKKDLPTTNSSHSLIGINPIKRLSMGKNKNSTKKYYRGTPVNFYTTSQNKNLSEQKKVNRALTLNDLIHKSVVNKSREITNLKSLLWKKNQKLKKMKEEIDKMQEKVSVYESNNHHTILRQMGALRENGSQANFIMDQIDNFFKKRPTWSESTIRECATWVACSPTGYDFVRERKLMVLPSRRALVKYAYSGEQKVDFCNLSYR